MEGMIIVTDHIARIFLNAKKRISNILKNLQQQQQQESTLILLVK